MNTRNRPQRKPLVVLLAAALTASTLVAPLAQASVLDESISVQPGQPLTAKDESVIASAGAKVLQHITEARARLAKKDGTGAEQELNQATKLLDIIQAALPPTVIKDRIDVANKKGLDYQDSRTVKPDLVPLYTSLDETADLMAVKPVPVKPGAPAPTKQVEVKPGKVEEPTDAALQYTEVDLPLHSTRQLVDAARNDVTAGKLAQADQALKAAQDGVLFMSVAVEQPLFVARNMLQRATSDLAAGHKAVAQTDLQAAIDQLKMAENSSDPYTRDGAQIVLKEARTVQADLQAGKDLGGRMEALWRRSEAYAERAKEYMHTGWARMESESPLKIKLIETRRYLSDAQIDTFTARELSRARQDLNHAASYLDQASNLAHTYYTDPIYKKQITDLQQTVKAIKTDPAGSTQKFASADSELNLMINSL